MYASHLAINHFASRGQINLIQKPYLIDYSCTKNTSFHEEEIIHIHAWHVRSSLRWLLFTSLLFSVFLDFRDFLEVSLQERFVRSSIQPSNSVEHELFPGLSLGHLSQITTNVSDRTGGVARREVTVNCEHCHGSASSSMDFGFSVNIVR